MGFELIDHSIESLQNVAFYGDFLSTGKWLLIAGFTVQLINLGSRLYQLDESGLMA